MSALFALFRFAVGSVLRRKGRSFSVFFAIAATVGVLSASLFAMGALSAEAKRAEAGAHDLVVTKLVAGRPALVPAAVAEGFAKVPGVRRASPRVWGPLFVPLLSGNVTVVGAGPEGVDPRGEGNAPVLPGRCVLGDVLARAVGVRPGDELKMESALGAAFSCTVSGVFSSSVSMIAADVVVVPESDARMLLGVPGGQAVDVVVDLVTPDEAPAFARHVEETLAGARIVDKRLVRRVHALALSHRAGFVLGALLPVALAGLVLFADRLSGVGARERREIAVVKAAGWATADVLAMKAMEAAVLALVGATTGLLAGYAWAFLIGAPILREVLAGWGHVAARGPLVPDVGLADFAAIVGLVVGPFVALTVAPAYRAASQDPLAAMREA